MTRPLAPIRCAFSSLKCLYPYSQGTAPAQGECHVSTTTITPVPLAPGAQ